MSLQLIHLRKLLRIMYSAENRRVSMLRADIRDEIAREEGESPGGGDFYGPFWFDAKNHVFGIDDLHRATTERISRNERRRILYPQLRDGFLLWWNQRRRWTNEPFQAADAPKTRIHFESLDAVVKIDNILAVRDARGEVRYVYPYFSPDPELSDEAARLGLYVLSQALPDINPLQFRILDVIRGRTFSTDRNPFLGDEERLFLSRYQNLLNQWHELWDDYD
ncbi:MAG: hypothetical protein WA793_09755 [Sphingorhabdus sp.]|uniref:hypothetical protein n=1 Tax=Sphingorhabdus sp. TaxID=1902408 RepID=UPI003CB9A49B